MGLYRNRRDGGTPVAAAFARRYAEREDVVILALPRGGVPVGFEVASRLGARLDVFVVRKLGVPGHEELAMGAIASGNVRILDEDLIDQLGISDDAIEATTAREAEELLRREWAYRGARPPIDVAGQTAILVDDGLATGSTMRAAIAGLRHRGPARVVVGVPIAAPSTCAQIASEVDDIVCAAMPEAFRAVGHWYRDFSQTTDDEVRELLDRATREHAARARPLAPQPRA